MKEVAPGIYMPDNVRRVVYEDDPRGPEYTAAHEEVEKIRGELGALRHRLRAVGKIEAEDPNDSLAEDARSALTLAIIALYQLVDHRHDNRHGLLSRAARADALWRDVEENPDRYVVEKGTGRDARKLSRARDLIERTGRAVP